jgi:hypothetical protein
MGSGRVSAKISIDRRERKSNAREIVNAFFATPNVSAGRRGCAGRRPRMTPKISEAIISA